jgi:fructose-1,6-bisphosphatase/sedoheptulose 1,7-bisphosphatase-like protein
MDLLVEARRRVAAGTMTAARCNELDMVTGLNGNPHGVLASVPLRTVVDPISVFTYDWVHNMLQDGVFSVEVQALLETAGIERRTLFDFLSADSLRHSTFTTASL